MDQQLDQPVPRRRSYLWLWIIIGIFCLVLFVFIGMVAIGLSSLKGSNDSDAVEWSGSGGRVGVVELTGVITSSKEFMQQIRRYYDDDSVKAIIVHIDSPGGGAAVSQEIYTELNQLRGSHKKPVVSSIESVGASGAYYVAAGTDKIYANAASVVGSVGVIAEWVNYGDLMRWAKLKPVVLQAGKLKSAGDPSRDLTPEERAYMQGLVDDMHHQFIRDVAAGRHISEDQLKPLATGQVWTGEQAVPLKLIDGVATYRQVVERVGKQVGIGNNPTVITPEKRKRTAWDLVFGDVTDLLPNKLQTMRGDPGFFYMWR
jgi:protease IV